MTNVTIRLLGDASPKRRVAQRVGRARRGGRPLSNLELAVPMLFAAMAAGTLAIAVLLRRGAPGALWASVLLLGAIAWWSAGAAYEMLERELSGKILAAQAQYFGILLAPAAFFMMALTFTGHQRLVRRRVWWLLAAEPAVMLALVWTNGAHGLVWTTIEIERFGEAELLVFRRGPAFYVNVLYSYALMLVGAALLARAAVRGGSAYRTQAVLLLVAAVTPWVANIVSQAGLLSVPVDLTPFGFVVTGVLIAIAVSRLGMFDLVTLGRGAVMDSIHPGIVVLDETGRIVEMNPAAQLMAGTSGADVVGRPVGEVLTVFGDLTADTELPSVSHAEVAGADGPLYYEVRLSTLGSPGSMDRGRLVVLRDATLERLAEAKLTDANTRLEEQVERRTAELTRELQERKTTELALRDTNFRLERTMGQLEEAQRQVVQEERSRALGEMAGGIAHEFNNSLMPIVGYAQLLADDPDLLNGETSRLYVENIVVAAKDATEVAARMKEFYLQPPGPGELVPLELGKLIRRTLELTEPRWKTQPEADGHPVRVLLDLPDEALVVGDATKLREVFTNLIFNAVDAMPEGGTIHLRTRLTVETVVIEVADTGVGMSEATLRRCLDPFFSTKGERGTGLGLSVVHGIMERHGGRVEVESELGAGTTIRLTLTAASPTPESGSKDSEPVDSALAGLRVLAVDDDAGVLGVIGAMTRAQGHEVVLAGSAQDALERFRSGDFDVVIADLAMPDMSGRRLAEALREIDPGVIIIIMTGFAGSEEAGAAEGSVAAIIEKPVTPMKLRQALQLAA